MQYFSYAGVNTHRHPTDTGCRSLFNCSSYDYTQLLIPRQKKGTLLFFDDVIVRKRVRGIPLYTFFIKSIHE